MFSIRNLSWSARTAGENYTRYVFYTMKVFGEVGKLQPIKNRKLFKDTGA